MADVPVRSVKKALNLLSILVFEDVLGRGLTLSQLAARMDMPANTAHNLLKTMAACGFVAQTDGARYISGPKCRDIGHLNQIRSQQMSEVLQPLLRTLGEELSESVLFATLAGGRRIVPLRVHARQVVAVDSQAVDGLRIYDLPTGRVLVAWADEGQLNDIIAQYGWPGPRWADITDRAQLQAAIAPLRGLGHCTIVPDRNEVASFACPVFKRGGELLGAVGCYAPLFRCPPGKQATIIERMKATAARIQRALPLDQYVAPGQCG